MESFSLDELVSEVNQYAGLPDPQSLISVAKTEVRGVFRSIGIELLSEYKSEYVQLKNGKARLPNDVLIVDKYVPKSQLGNHKFESMEYKQHWQNMQNTKGYVFKQTPFEIIVSDDDNGEGVLFYWGFYKDEEGGLMIPEVAYRACVEMCIYKALDLALDNPRWQTRLIHRQNADRAIIEARGNINSSTNARVNTLHHFFGSQKQRRN